MAGFDENIPFYSLWDRQRFGGEDRVRMKRVCVGAFALECAQQQAALIGSASEGGGFGLFVGLFVCFGFVNEKPCFRHRDNKDPPL